MLVLGIIITVTIIINVGWIGEIDQKLTAIDPMLSSNIVFSNPQFGPFTGIAIFISLGFVGLTPQMSKIWLALDDERNIGKTLLWAAVGTSILGLVMWFGGLGARAIFPDIAPDAAILNVITQLLPNWLTGFAMIGIFAAILSTTAGLFLTVSVAIVMDIYRDTILPMRKKKIPEKKLDRQLLTAQRIALPFIVIAGILIAESEPKSLTELIWLGLGLFTGSIIPTMVIIFKAFKKGYNRPSTCFFS